jgi:hypothetical protein
VVYIGNILDCVIIIWASLSVLFINDITTMIIVLLGCVAMLLGVQVTILIDLLSQSILRLKKI